MKIKIYKQILAAYSSLGDRPKGTPKSLHYFLCWRWGNPVMSPVFPSSIELKVGHLEDVDSIFKKLRKNHFYDSKFAYLNSLVKPSKQFQKSAKEINWEIFDSTSTLNYWDKKNPLKLSKEYSIWSGHYFEPKIRKLFRQEMKKNFPLNNFFMKELEAMIKLKESNIRTVLIMHKSGVVAASGLTATHNKSCFLFCGSVNKRFRGKGLWKNLVAARQIISETQGAAFWVTTT
jgi:hypothetical protein